MLRELPLDNGQRVLQLLPASGLGVLPPRFTYCDRDPAWRDEERRRPTRIVAPEMIYAAGRDGMKLLVAYGASSLYHLSQQAGFDQRSERKYPEGAALARSRTHPASVIFAMQHSGSVRYYAGRTTAAVTLIGPSGGRRSGLPVALRRDSD